MEEGRMSNLINSAVRSIKKFLRWLAREKSCGNGIVEPALGEQCDPAAGSGKFIDAICHSTTCKLVPLAVLGVAEGDYQEDYDESVMTYDLNNNEGVTIVGSSGLADKIMESKNWPYVCLVVMTFFAVLLVIWRYRHTIRRAIVEFDRWFRSNRLDRDPPQRALFQAVVV